LAHGLTGTTVAIGRAAATIDDEHGQAADRGSRL